jgi:hypothetical protein
LTPPDKPDKTAAMPGGARPRFPRWIIALGVASPIALAGAGASYWSYKSEHLREPPRRIACVQLAQRRLGQPEPLSGFEAHGTPSGGTVFLRPTEDSAVRCMHQISSPVAQRLAEAYAILDEEPRAAALSTLAKDVIAKHPEDDALVFTTVMLTAPAMVGEAPPIKAAKKELEELIACRYDTRVACPSRPPIPVLVYVLGVPGALGILVLFGSFVYRVGSWVARWRRARRELRQARLERRRARRLRKGQ